MHTLHTLTSTQLSIEVEDLNSLETALERSLNELGPRNLKNGHACCTCCAASEAEFHSK